MQRARQKLLVISPFLARAGMERQLASFFEHYDTRQFEIGFVYFKRLYPKTQTSPLEKSLRRISYTWQIKPHTTQSLRYQSSQLTEIVKTWEPDAILAKEWFPACIAVRARQRLPSFVTRPRIVCLLENDPTLSFTAQLASERLSTAKRLIYARYIRQCDVVIGVSRGVTRTAAQVFSLPKQKLCTIYNSVDMHVVQQQARLSPAHPWLTPTPHHVQPIPVIVSSGRLSPEKDQATLIHALALLDARQPVRLILLGEGTELHHLKTLAKKLHVSSHIDFHGYAANPFTVMAHADVFVMTSTSEGFPSVLLEAMACGVPVVYTDCPHGPNEIIQNGKNGFLVPVGDASAVADCVQKILKSTSLRDRLIKAASKTVLDFSVEKHVEQLGMVLLKI